MSLKRPHDTTPLDDRRKKRLHSSVSLPVTPAASHISLSTPLKTRTLYPLHPSDSPGNPFGRKRIKHLTRTLPESTSFSKHLPLRFQFIRTGSTSPRQGGVYRVVQVPLSYTFIHLRCLIAWLFSGLPEREGIDEHLFEVKKDVSIYSHLYKPGQVKSGQTWVKLSSSQDPYRYQKGYLNDDGEEQEEDELSSDVDEKSQREEESGCEDEDLEDWKWEDEDDFTLGHAWPKGPELERAIIYHHSLTTQIHITVNQTSIPRRRGRSNTPHVFSARGRVWLSLPPLPRPIFAVPAKKVKSPGQKQKQSPQSSEDEDAEADTEAASETESETEENQTDDEDDQAENIDLELDPQYWNSSANGFAKFLTRYMGSVLPAANPSSSRVASSFDHEEEYLSEGDTLLYPSTPGLTRSSSVPSSPGPILATSSPSRASSCAPVVIALPSKSDAEDSEGDFVTLSLPAFTPFPVKARPIRKRMERVEKRMGKMKNGKWLCQNDDQDDEDDDEKDELADDNDSETLHRKVDRKGVRAEESEPLDWDPFGDEEEL